MGEGYDSDSGDTFEEIITEFVVEEREDENSETEFVVKEREDEESEQIEATEYIVNVEAQNIGTVEDIAQKVVKSKCSVCGEEFMHKSSLCWHMKQKHGDILGKENKSRVRVLDN